MTWALSPALCPDAPQTLITMAGSRPVPLLDQRHFTNLEIDDFLLRGEELERDDWLEGPSALQTGDWQEQEPDDGQPEAQQLHDAPSRLRSDASALMNWDGQCNGRAVHVERELAVAGLPRIAIEVLPEALRPWIRMSRKKGGGQSH